MMTPEFSDDFRALAQDKLAHMRRETDRTIHLAHGETVERGVGLGGIGYSAVSRVCMAAYPAHSEACRDAFERVAMARLEEARQLDGDDIKRLAESADGDVRGWLHAQLTSWARVANNGSLVQQCRQELDDYRGAMRLEVEFRLAAFRARRESLTDRRSNSLAAWQTWGHKVAMVGGILGMAVSIIQIIGWIRQRADPRQLPGEQQRKAGPTRRDR